MTGFAAEARAVQDPLRERLLPYWRDTGVDWTGGGYRLCDDAIIEPRSARRNADGREKSENRS